jgi:hypothetical protein
VDGNNLQGSASYTMVILDAEVLTPGNDDFTMKDYESEKQIQLSFFLPKDFDDAKILDVEALTSPDACIAGSSSTITKEQNEYRIKLTLRVSEYALSNGGNWSALLENLTLDGLVVKFQDASGEEIRFEEALLVKELKREEEPGNGNGNEGDSGGGCNAVWGASLFSLLLVAALTMRKRG